MPELPEVETIRRQLVKVLPGKFFSRVEIHLAKQVKGLSVKKFKQVVAGSKIVGLDRRAKMLIIRIKNQESRIKNQEKFMVFHLKMTGQLIYQARNEKRETERLVGGGHPIKGSLQELPNKYSHVIFRFQDGTNLFFNDLRQFGWVTLVDSHKAIESLSKTPLGPEPLTKDFALSGFVSCLKNRPWTRIYQALLDQQCVVGVGNIYANESLFYAGLRPTRRIKYIKPKEYNRLYQGIRKILKQSIDSRGTTIGDYMDALGEFGAYSRRLKVYRRAGRPCSRAKCSGIVQRLKINSRSVFYCNSCQS